MSSESDLSFESALKQLEAIVGDLERGEPELSAALARYEQGVRLVARCQRLLDEAGQSVAFLTGVDDTGRPLTAPFGTAAPPRSADEDDGAPF